MNATGFVGRCDAVSLSGCMVVGMCDVTSIVARDGYL